MPYGEAKSLIGVVADTITALELFVKALNFLSRNARTKQRDFDEQVHELRDTVGVIEYTLDKLRDLEAEKTANKKMKKMALHNRLATEIRRFVYLSQVKIPNTWAKLQRYQKQEDPNHPLEEMPPIEKLIIHTDNASGINIEILTKLLSVPAVDSRFTYGLRWIQNRFHFFSFFGTTLPPPVPKKVLEYIPSLTTVHHRCMLTSFTTQRL